VVRPGFDNGLTAEQQAHPSETALDHTRPDWKIYNAGSLPELRSAVRLWVKGKLSP
jgi:hypothetical protein